MKYNLRVGSYKIGNVAKFSRLCAVHSGIEVRDYLRLMKLGTKFGMHFNAKLLFGVQNVRTTSNQSTLLKHNKRCSLLLLLLLLLLLTELWVTDLPEGLPVVLLPTCLTNRNLG